MDFQRLKTFSQVIVLVMSPLTGFAGEWGSVEGQFIAAKDVENPPPLLKAAGPACRIPFVPDDSLVIHSENRGLANVIVYLPKAPQQVHPNLAQTPKEKLTFTVQNCRFTPHVLAVRTGQPVNCTNPDKTAYQLHTNPVKSERVVFDLRAGDLVGQDVKFDFAETLPVNVVCGVHPWMISFWMVTDHPYVAVTDADGKFKIENLPVGEHKFRVWHERQGYLNREYKVKIAAGKTNVLKVEEIPAAKLSRK